MNKRGMNQTLSQVIRGTLINLDKARCAGGHVTHFTPSELYWFMPMWIEVSLNQVKHEVDRMEKDGFITIWGRKHSGLAYQLNTEV